MKVRLGSFSKCKMRLFVGHIPAVLSKKCNVVRVLSTQQSAVQEKKHEDKTKMDEQLKQFENIAKMTTRVRTKKPQRPPFLKSLLLSKFDTELLTYPQMEMEDLNNLKLNLKPIEDFFSENKKQNLIASLEDLKRLELFGMQGPQTLGGREYNNTETLRFLEIISKNPSVVHSYITNEFVGLQALFKFAKKPICDQYLPDMVKGNLLPAFCMMEEDMGDMGLMNTQAKITHDLKTWVINGKKTGVLNGHISNLFLVMATTNVIKGGTHNLGRFSMFLVDRNSPGITVKSYNRLDVDGNQLCDVTFDNTPVPDANMLGDLNMGEKVATSLLSNLRLAQGASCITLIRNLLNNMIDYCNTRKSFIPITEAELIQSNISDMSKSLYALESMTYFTSFLLDQYEDQDCDMESLFVKIHGVRSAIDCTLKSIELVGQLAQSENHWANKSHQSALLHQIVGESGNNLSVMGALFGLQHIGREIQETVKAKRNPYFFPSQIWKSIWTTRRNVYDNPKLTLRLSDYLHPSLKNAAEELEYCVFRLQYATELLLITHGQEVMNKHIDLISVSECILKAFAMSTTLARASRSYCIGLPNSEYEISIAMMICREGMIDIKRRVQLLQDGREESGFGLNLSIGKRMFNSKSYFPVHPTDRTF